MSYDASAKACDTHACVPNESPNDIQATQLYCKSALNINVILCVTFTYFAWVSVRRKTDDLSGTQVSNEASTCRVARGLILRAQYKEPTPDVGFHTNCQLPRCSSLAGYVACTCNPAPGRHGEVDGLMLGVLLSGCLRRTGVRTKPGIDMVPLEESRGSRSTKEERNGPEGKPSSLKFPCRAVVGSRP